MNLKTIKKYFLNIQIIRIIKNNFGDSAYSLLNLLTFSISAFILNVLLVRFLSDSDIGAYKTFFDIINILIIFSVNGLNITISKSVAKGYKNFFLRATKISFFSSISASVILVALSFTFFKDSSLRYILIYSSVVIPFYFGLNTWEFLLLGKKDFKKIFINNSFINLTKLVVCGVILFYLRDFVLTLLAFLLIVTIYNIIYFLRVLKKTKWGERDLPKEKGLMQHGLRITGSSVISVIAKYVERLILLPVSSMAVVGIYSQVNIIPTFIKDSLKTVISVPTIKLASYSESENRRVIRKYLFIIFFTGIGIFLLFWFISPFLLSFFFNISDPVKIWYSKIILIPLIFMPFNLSIKNMCRYQGSGSSFLKLNTTTDAMKLVLLGAFIPFFKIYGIIIALALTEFLSFFILLIWFIRSNKKFVVK